MNEFSEENVKEIIIEKGVDAVDWADISFFYELSEEFMDRYSEYLSWSDISENQKISFNFIKRHNSDIILSSLFENSDEDTINDIFENLDEFIKIFKGISDFNMDKLDVFLDGDVIYNRTRYFYIDKYPELFDWELLMTWYPLDEEFLETFDKYITPEK